MLSELRHKLHSLCYDYDWSDEVEDRIIRILRYIPERLSKDPNIDDYLQFLKMIINRHGQHTVAMIREKFSDELEQLYNDPKSEKNPMFLSILQKLHNYGEDFLMKLVDDAAYQWSDKKFDVLGINIEFWELKSRDTKAYERLLKYLRKKMDDAERKKDEKTYARFKRLYASAKR